MKKTTECKLFLTGLIVILMAMVFPANVSALLYDFIYVNDISCSLYPGWSIMPVCSVGLVANTGATDITVADFRTLNFNVQSSVPGITMTILPLHFGTDPAVFCPLLPREVVGLVLPDQNGMSFNSLLLSQIQQNENLKNG
ncbi:MAG: hypothetical protein PHV60_04780, partial [bacterium]|nr:hypothetical protein [bacterium]